MIAGGGSAGWTGGHFVASAEIYDRATGKFTPTGPMTVERALHTTTLLADGRVLVTGGFNNEDDGSTSLASAELYDPKSGTFSPTGSMVDGRTFDAATLLADGRVLIAGGYNGSVDDNSAELYDPTTGTFALIGPGG